MKTQPRSWTGLAVGAVVLIFIAVIVFLWRIGLFDFSGTEASAKVIAAALVLVGTVITAAVSIVGIILRSSLDQQTEQRLKIEGDRNAALAKEAEERLKLEASIRAVGLLGTNDGDPVQPVQRAGALFALTSLGRYELATELTDYLLSENQLDAGSAVAILNRALTSEDPDVQFAAINSLRVHIKQMILEDGQFAFPKSLLDWDLGMSPYAREWGTVALGELMTARAFEDWNLYELYEPICALCFVWMTEPMPRIKNAAGTMLRSILPAIPHVVLLLSGQTNINVREIRAQISTLSVPVQEQTGTVYIELAERLRIWAGGAEEEREAKS